MEWSLTDQLIAVWQSFLLFISEINARQRHVVIVRGDAGADHHRPFPLPVFLHLWLWYSARDRPGGIHHATHLLQWWRGAWLLLQRLLYWGRDECKWHCKYDTLWAKVWICFLVFCCGGEMSANGTVIKTLCCPKVLFGSVVFSMSFFLFEVCFWRHSFKKDILFLSFVCFWSIVFPVLLWKGRRWGYDLFLFVFWMSTNFILFDRETNGDRVWWQFLLSCGQPVLFSWKIAIFSTLQYFNNLFSPPNILKSAVCSGLSLHFLQGQSDPTPLVGYTFSPFTEVFGYTFSLFIEVFGYTLSPCAEVFGYTLSPCTEVFGYT